MTLVIVWPGRKDTAVVVLERSRAVSEASDICDLWTLTPPMGASSLLTFGAFAPWQLYHQIQVVSGQGILGHGLRHLLHSE